MKRNLTVQLDASIIRKAHIVAARRSTSVSRLVAMEIERAATADDSYERAKSAALACLERPFHLGGGALPARELLHER